MKGFNLVVNLLTMPNSLAFHVRLTHKKVKRMFHWLPCERKHTCQNYRMLDFRKIEIKFWFPNR